MNKCGMGVQSKQSAGRVAPSRQSFGWLTWLTGLGHWNLYCNDVHRFVYDVHRLMGSVWWLDLDGLI
jgi:hypothetical protein